jgi:hypothetical protein
MVQMSRSIMLLVTGLVLALASGPITSATTSASQPPTQIRVLNALPESPAVDVLIDGAPTATGLAFGANPQYVAVPPGSHAVVVTLPGAPAAPLVSTQLTVAPGASFTLFAIAPVGAAPTFIVLPDEPPGAGGPGANARFVHASPNTPSVDLAVTGGPILFSNIAFGQASPYLPVPAGPVDLEARLAGTPVVVLEIPPFTLAPGMAYTFGAIGLTGGVPLLGFITLTDL